MQESILTEAQGLQQLGQASSFEGAQTDACAIKEEWYHSLDEQTALEASHDA